MIIKESFSSCFFHVSKKSRFLLSVFFNSDFFFLVFFTFQRKVVFFCLFSLTQKLSKKKKFMNRSLNIERAKLMTAVSQIRSDFSMSSRYEDFFQKSKKSSRIQKISKLNLIISKLKKLKTRSSIKSSFFTQLYKRKKRIVQNHSAKNENREITEMTKTNFNVRKYTKTKYNRNAIILLFILATKIWI